MRYILTLTLMLLPAFGFAAGPRLELSDPGLPLQSVRPLDRQAYVLTLHGTWNGTPSAATHYVNIVFPDGGRYAHRVLDDARFRQGEVRCLIEEYQLVRHGIADGGQFAIEVSANAPLERGENATVVSNLFFVEWPMQRKLVRYRPRSRIDAPLPVDVFPLPGQDSGPTMIPPPRRLKEEGK